MKLTCDLCGGSLQMNAGALDASCKSCGLCYSLEILRQKLGAKNAAPAAAPSPVQEAPKPQPEVLKPIVSHATQPSAPVVSRITQPSKPVATPAEQFVMPVKELFAACLTGYVQQGCIGVGEQVFINGDYSRPYRLYHFGSNSNDTTHASAGEYAKLYLVPYRRDVLKQARVITGSPNPTPNAYRYKGSVAGYFENLLLKNFSEYTLQKQVQWGELKIPIDFMLLKNGRPVAAIFIFGSNDGCSRYQAQKASELLGRAVIGCTHFYRDYRNDAPYVIDRIRKVIDPLPH